MISSTYDPFGFIALVVVIGRKILQDICHSNTWDEPVDDATRSRWEKRQNKLCSPESLKVPRSFKTTEFGKIVSAQLNCMSDASTWGYGQCSYLRLEQESRKVHVTFVVAIKGLCDTGEDSQHEIGIGRCHDFFQYW